MNKSAIFLAFVAGAAVGAAGTWQFARKKWEKIAQEEIDSVKETYGRKRYENEECQESPVKDNPDISEQIRIIKEHGYANSHEEARILSDIPYVITPEQFGELEDYSTVSLTYFLDGSLVDGDYEVIEDADEVIGMESLNHFGEYEDDSVFVRNDRLKSDYEILLDQRSYKDVLKTMPHRAEVR